MKNLDIIQNNEESQNIKIVFWAADSVTSDKLSSLINLVNEMALKVTR